MHSVVLRFVTVLSLAACFGTVAAQPARLPFDARLTLATPRELRIPPGASGDIDIIVTNAGATPAAAFRVTHGSVRVGQASVERRADSDCGQFSRRYDYPAYSTLTHELEVPALGAGQSATCRLRVVRPNSAIHDSSLHWYVLDTASDYAGNYIWVYAGRLSDLDLSIAYETSKRLPDGRLHAVHTLTTRNRSPTPLASAALVFCFGIPSVFPHPVTIDGCELTGRRTDLDYCGFYELGPIDAHGEASCRLGVVSPTNAAAFERSVEVWSQNFAPDGGEILDVGTGRKSGVLRLYAPALGVPIGLGALVGIAVAMIAIARRKLAQAPARLT